MDLFEEWLSKKNNSQNIKRALCDNSFKKYSQQHKINYKGEFNKELATLGDAVLKLCYCIKFFDDGNPLTVEKSQYESDKVLVSKIAKHYDLLKYMDFDKNDTNLLQEYDYEKGQTDNSKTGNNGNKTKFIATAVEAMIGAIYLETKDIDSIVDLLKNWVKIINN